MSTRGADLKTRAPHNFLRKYEASKVVRACGMSCTFLLGNVLHATTACAFSTSQLPKVVRDRQFLSLLT